MENKLYVKFENLDNHNATMETFFILCSKIVEHNTAVGKEIGPLADFVLRGCVYFGEMARALELDDIETDDTNDLN